MYLLSAKHWAYGSEQGRQPCPCSAYFAKDLAGPSQGLQGSVVKNPTCPWPHLPSPRAEAAEAHVP